MAVLAACHDSTGPQSGASLRFSGAVAVSDTIEAKIPQALTVEVHDSTGSIAPMGTVVRFTAMPSDKLFGGPEVSVEALSSTFYDNFASGLTDAAGRTAVLVRLGPAAGTGRLVVSVPTLGLEDTVPFTIKPGNPVRVRVTPADTVIYAGKSYTLSGGVADRWDNPRPDPVTWSSSDPGVSVSSSGVVTATAIGRYRIRAQGTAGGTVGTDSGWVSVVPTGVLAAVSYDGYYVEPKLFSMNADGTGESVLATVRDGGIGVHPNWIPGTSTIVYTTVASGVQTLYTVGTDATPRRFFPTGPATVTHQAEPTPSADGKWLYLSVFDSRCSTSDYCVARSAIDATGYELLLTTPSRQPSPSPDGSKVAYYSPNNLAIRVFDVASRTSSSWSVTGRTPVWSPDGTTIAFCTPNGAVGLISPTDGSVRMLPTTGYTSSLSGWTPDNKWLIGLQTKGVLINAATGATLPVAYAHGKLPMSVK